MRDERTLEPLSLDPAASNTVFSAVAGIHVIAAAALLHLAAVGMVWQSLAGLSLILASLLWYWMRLRDQRMPRLEFDAAGVLLLSVGSELVYAQVDPDSVVLDKAVCLQWRAVGDAPGRGAMWLFPDQMPSNAWRRLQIWLRHHCRPSSANSGFAPKR